MFTAGFIFIILGFLGLSWPVADVNAIKSVRSSYCGKALLDPEFYPLSRRECCDRSCSDYIEPGKTKHGLTNSVSHWTVRHCRCDAAFYRCLTKNQNIQSIRETREAFRDEICFDVVHVHRRRGHSITYWEFFPSLTRISATVFVDLPYHRAPPTNSSMTT